VRCANDANCLAFRKHPTARVRESTSFSRSYWGRVAAGELRSMAACTAVRTGLRANGTQHIALDAARRVPRSRVLLRGERLHRNVDFRDGPGSDYKRATGVFLKGPEIIARKRRGRNGRACRARSIRKPAHPRIGAGHQSSRSRCNCTGRRRFTNSAALPKCSGPCEGVRFRQGSGNAGSSGEAWRCQWSTRRGLAVAVVGGASGASEHSDFPIHNGPIFCQLGIILRAGHTVVPAKGPGLWPTLKQREQAVVRNISDTARWAAGVSRARDRAN